MILPRKSVPPYQYYYHYYFFKCEFLSVQVKENFPNIDFRVIIKDPREWDNYIKDVII